jgi:hypothetical protein
MPPEVATYDLNTDAESLQSTPETFPKRLKLSFVRGAAKAHFVRVTVTRFSKCCVMHQWLVW